eukprot:6194432-Pleurochrysis_carterae.AAC.2
MRDERGQDLFPQSARERVGRRGALPQHQPQDQRARGGRARLAEEGRAAARRRADDAPRLRCPRQRRPLLQGVACAHAHAHTRTRGTRGTPADAARLLTRHACSRGYTRHAARAGWPRARAPHDWRSRMSPCSR